MDKRMVILTRRNGLRRRGGASGRKEAMKDTSMAPKLKVQTNGRRGPFYSRRSRLILFTRERWSVIGGEASWLRCREGQPTRSSFGRGAVEGSSSQSFHVHFLLSARHFLITLP